MRLIPVLPFALALSPAAFRVRAETPALILSEILADPAALPDAQGEFLELGNPGADGIALAGVAVYVDGQAFAPGPIGLGPGRSFLICRDSAAYAAAGVACDRGWGAMSLANSRGLEVAAAWEGGGFRAAVPPARPGTSWENTWDGASGFSDFLPCRAGRAGGDSATPGGRNSRSVRPAARDLALEGIGAAGGIVQVTVADRGSSPPPPSRLALRLDGDWDGRAERVLDSIELDSAGPFPRVARFAIGAAAGRLEAGLGPDEDPGNNALAAALEPAGCPLAFGAIRAAPAGGEPEWVEIRNAAAGRRISLALASLDGIPLGPAAGSLGAGERAFLTPDTAAFRARFGPIKAKVLKPASWRALRNAGDTLILSLAGLSADTAAWGPAGAAGAGVPGGAKPPAAAGWAVSGRTAFPDSPLEVEVRTPPGDGYVLRAFDLEGNRVREIGRGGPGLSSHAWDGRGDGGRALPRGAYVLCLSFGKGGSRKRAIAAGER